MSAITLTSPSQIEAARWAAIKGALKLEQRGLKRRGRSCRQIVIKASNLPAGSSYETLIEWCENTIKELRNG